VQHVGVLGDHRRCHLGQRGLDLARRELVHEVRNAEAADLPVARQDVLLPQRAVDGDLSVRVLDNEGSARKVLARGRDQNGARHPGARVPRLASHPNHGGVRRRDERGRNRSTAVGSGTGRTEVRLHVRIRVVGLLGQNALHEILHEMDELVLLDVLLRVVGGLRAPRRPGLDRPGARQEAFGIFVGGAGNTSCRDSELELHARLALECHVVRLLLWHEGHALGRDRHEDVHLKGVRVEDSRREGHGLSAVDRALPPELPGADGQNAALGESRGAVDPNLHRCGLMGVIGRKGSRGSSLPKSQELENRALCNKSAAPPQRLRWRLGPLALCR